MMPYTALGAIVLYTGYKLCAPKVWKHVAHIGSEQLLVFTATVLVTVSTDLLWGIAAGILAKLIVEMVMVARVGRGRPEGREPLGVVVKRRLGETGELFRDPVIKSVDGGGTYHIYFGRPLVCFNSLYLHRELSLVPSGATVVTIHITDLVTLIDHTTATILLDFVDNFKRTGRGVATIVGLDNLRARSHAEASMRVSAAEPCTRVDAQPLLHREFAGRAPGVVDLPGRGHSDRGRGGTSDPVGFGPHQEGVGTCESIPVPSGPWLLRPHRGPSQLEPDGRSWQLKRGRGTKPHRQ